MKASSRRQMVPKKKRGTWSKEACSQCGNEGYASRTEPTEGDYICSECEMYQRGWDDSKKEALAIAKDYDKMSSRLANLEEQVVRAMLRLYNNSLPSGRRSYQLLADAVGDEILTLEGMPREHPDQKNV